MKHILLTIKARLIAGFAFMFVLTGCLGAFGYYGITTLGVHIDDLYRSNTQPIIDVSTVRAATLRIRLALWRAQVEKNAEATQRLAADIDKARAELDSSWRHYYPDGISSESERAVAQAIAAQLANFTEESEQVLKLIRAGDYDGARTHQIERLAPVADVLNRRVDEDMRDNIEQADQNARESNALAARNRMMSITLIAVGALVSLLLPMFLVRAVTRSLATAREIAQRVAAGRLGEPVPAHAGDEIGAVINTLTEMDEKLVSTVRAIRSSSDSVLVASGQIASGNLDLSARTEQQAAALEQTAATMSEITETVKQNADNARQADTLAKNALDLSDTNNQSVAEMVRTMDRISDSAGKIAEITTMIEGIAFQTNILALNAAVEAARAGEQGRGFAVVAGEVRTLAQRSSTAAKQIKELIDQSSIIVDAGAAQVAGVETSMREVARVINMVSDIIGEIAAASDEQNRGVAQVHQAISEIDGVTQQNAALVEEISTAAQSLEDQASRMQAEVRFFQLAGDAANVVVAASTLSRAQTGRGSVGAVATARAPKPLRSQPTTPAGRHPPRRETTPVQTGTAAHDVESWETF